MFSDVQYHPHEKLNASIFFTYRNTRLFVELETVENETRLSHFSHLPGKTLCQLCGGSKGTFCPWAFHHPDEANCLLKNLLQYPSIRLSLLTRYRIDFDNPTLYGIIHPNGKSQPMIVIHQKWHRLVEVARQREERISGLCPDFTGYWNDAFVLPEAYLSKQELLALSNPYHWYIKSDYIDLSSSVPTCHRSVPQASFSTARIGFTGFFFYASLLPADVWVSASDHAQGF